MYSMVDNINIERIEPLPPPSEIKSKYKLSDKSKKSIVKSREHIKNILAHKVNKLLVIVGPCSIHDTEEAYEYAKKLKALSLKFENKLQLVMRVYFEKPRKTIGWKGFIYDPDLDGTCNIKKGIEEARKLLLNIAKLELPVASEILDPITVEYIADIISWAAIGARTTESQPHRQLVSGLSMPVGFKNTTNGNVQAAIDAIKAANHKHAFLGLMPDGKNAIFHTKGNHFAHVVLRGGSTGPNYTSEYTAFTRKLMERNKIIPNIIIDCSHANSDKKASNQEKVLKDLINQKLNGEDSIIGVMVESNLKHGKQPINNLRALIPGISITDECIGWEETEKLITNLYNRIN
jgi:3-deoxy-7-phosphoheptulonate synthase